MTSRRQFIQIAPLAAASLWAAGPAHAQLVVEKDPQAAALGYVADASRVDKSKYKNFAAGQQCGNCALYQGKPTDAAGGCPLFAARQVAGKGWCSAYAKKAG